MASVFSNLLEMIFKTASILQRLGLLIDFKKFNYIIFIFNLLFCRVNESGKDPGFGQSILHDCQLIFHTPPYNIGVIIHDHPVPQWPNIRQVNKVKTSLIFNFIISNSTIYAGSVTIVFILK